MRVRILAGCVTAVLVLLAGCASHDSGTAARRQPSASSSGSGLDRAFWLRAGRACHPFLVFDEAHPTTVPGMDPEHPTVAQLRALAAFDRRFPSPFAKPGAWTRIMTGLGSPRTGKSEWRAVVAAFRRYDAAGDAEQAAIKALDPAAWHLAYDSRVAAIGDLAIALDAVGVPSSNDCERLFN